jgi:hypothetical protein
MKGEHLERWRYLAARITEEQDPNAFDQLVEELLQELQLKTERLHSTQSPVQQKPTSAAD